MTFLAGYLLGLATGAFYLLGEAFYEACQRKRRGHFSPKRHLDNLDKDGKSSRRECTQRPVPANSHEDVS